MARPAASRAWIMRPWCRIVMRGIVIVCPGAGLAEVGRSTSSASHVRESRFGPLPDNLLEPDCAAPSDPSDPEARAALEHLCRDYWYPLYAFVRRQGYGPDDACDLVQGFLADLLERRDLAAVDPGRGRFRSFLRAACTHFLAHHRERDRALKRGGGQRAISIDLPDAEGRYGREPAHDLTADRLFERRWALDLLGLVLARLEGEAVQAGKEELFKRLRPMLEGDDRSESYNDVGLALGLSEGAVKVAAHRLAHALPRCASRGSRPHRRRPGGSRRRALRSDQLACHLMKSSAPSRVCSTRAWRETGEDEEGRIVRGARDGRPESMPRLRPGAPAGRSRPGSVRFACFELVRTKIAPTRVHEPWTATAVRSIPIRSVGLDRTVSHFERIAESQIRSDPRPAARAFRPLGKAPGFWPDRPRRHGGRSEGPRQRSRARARRQGLA